MRFEGAFICGTCGHRYTIDIGPEQLKEWKTPKRIGEVLGGLAKLFARSCKDCESGHEEKETRRVHYGPIPGCIDPNCPIKDHED